MLSSFGFCSQSAEYLNEALSLRNAMRDEVYQTCGPEALELLDVVVLLASVYSKKSIIACHIYRFGLQNLNFMKKAERVHQLTVEMATTIFGDTHEKTADVMDGWLLRYSMSG